ncbi:MAG: hypothetical protein P8Y70_00035 [Candidatus Lokiarchaeota archaeon]
MALLYATVSPETNYTKGNSIYEHSVTLSSPGTSDDILLHDNTGRHENVIAGLSVSGGGQGKVQFTFSTRANVIAGTAVWFDWDSGSVNANTYEKLPHVSAIRLVNTAGTTVLEVRWV